MTNKILILLFIIVISITTMVATAQLAESGTINAKLWETSAYNEQKTDSGFDVIAGHKYIIQTTGNWYCGGGSCRYSDANGDKWVSSAAYPEEKVSTIIFFINSKKIGAGTNVTFVAENSGRLYSVFNDNPGEYTGNEGRVISTIEDITPSSPIALTLTKTASPYSIKQGQTTTVILTIKNTGTTDITNIEVMDSIHRNFDLISGDFPNPRKFDIIGKGESREIQYMIKAKDGGTFNLDPATGIYADKDGNIQEAKSEPFSVKVITYFEPNPIKTSAPASTPEPTTNPVKTASVSLYGEKTDVVLGEDILLKLSAVNLITKPTMHVQVIIIPPSGMSVTSSEFSKIAAGQFTANYELPPGDGRDIEVSIKSNQIGDFNVNGRIIYYFGDEKGTAEDHNLNLPIKVRKEIGSDSVQTQTPAQKSIPGFKLFTGISGLFLLAAILKRKR